MSAGFEEDDEDDESGVPIGAFHVQYLGNVSVSDIQGDEIVVRRDFILFFGTLLSPSFHPVPFISVLFSQQQQQQQQQATSFYADV